jgi:hypothetical protein
MKVQMLRRLRRTLISFGGRTLVRAAQDQPADEAWRLMIAKVNVAEAERRLNAAASALNARR